MGGKGYGEGGEGGQWRLKRRVQDLAFHGDSIQLLGEDQIEKSRIFNVLRFDNYTAKLKFFGALIALVTAKLPNQILKLALAL